MACLPDVCVCGVVCAMLEIVYLDGQCVKETFAIRLHLQPGADTAQEYRGFSYSKGLTV
jgi:hypothetical protein